MNDYNARFTTEALEATLEDWGGIHPRQAIHLLKLDTVERRQRTSSPPASLAQFMPCLSPLPTTPNSRSSTESELHGNTARLRRKPMTFATRI